MWGIIFVWAFWALIPAFAAAAPWVQAEDAGYLRLALSADEVEGLDAQRGDLYSEYGLTDWATLTLKAETVAYPDASDFNENGLRATLRARVFAINGFTGSAEVGALEGSAIGGRNGCETLGGEARTGLGWSGQLLDVETYMFGEVAGRFHEDCRRERFEFGVGQRATENIWISTQFWSERGTQNAKSDKTQTELVWRGSAYDFSIGYRYEFGGAFVEEGAFIALARRF